MPVHDWTRVDDGIFHAFHVAWITHLSETLNSGVLPPGYYALPEQVAGPVGPDVVSRSVAIRHVSGDQVVALIEVVSPGNKAGRDAIRSFTEEVTTVLDRRIHLLLIDLLPPGPRDPHGIHGVVSAAYGEQPTPLSPGQPFTLVAYEADTPPTAYVEFVGLGGVLPDMPLFLLPGWYVHTPLEATYQQAWRGVPQRWRDVIAGTAPL